MTTARFHRPLLASALLALAMLTPALARSDEPLDLDLREDVDVNLILIDFTVLDRQDRTVADLSIDDFGVTVMGREMEPISLDVQCPLGGTPPPRGGGSIPSLPDGATPPPQRIVLVYDYFHMPWATEAIDYTRRALRDRAYGDEEHMVVAMGEAVTIMTPFTRDTDEVVDALERMRTDVRLYGGNYGRLTEFRVFDRLESLMNVLERVPGNKKVVLFSGPFIPDGFNHDIMFRRISGLASQARVQIYPVDARGMTNGFALQDGISGPAELRRLANETGGRMTANTNDLSLAYARAHYDNRCTYTIGFYDRRVQPDRERRYKVWVERPGLRAVHSLYYVVRSRERQRASRLRTAGMAPEAFLDPALDVAVSLAEPRSKRWDAVVSATIAIAPEDRFPDDRPWQLKGWIRRPWGTIVGRFATDVTIGDDDAERIVEETVRLRPGRYIVNLALAHSDSSTPIAATVQVEIPEVPEPSPDETVEAAVDATIVAGVPSG